jgi:hypothetical protein
MKYSKKIFNKDTRYCIWYGICSKVNRALDIVKTKSYTIWRANLGPPGKCLGWDCSICLGQLVEEIQLEYGNAFLLSSSLAQTHPQLSLINSPLCGAYLCQLTEEGRGASSQIRWQGLLCPHLYLSYISGYVTNLTHYLSGAHSHSLIKFHLVTVPQ